MVYIARYRFQACHESIALTEDGAVVTMTVNDGYGRCAAGPVIGPSGVHWAEFVTELGSGAMLHWPMLCGGGGGGSNAYNVDGNCFFDTYLGGRHPGNYSTGIGPASSLRAPRATASGCGSTWALAA